MAIFVLRMKTFSRTSGHRGSRATSAAAYRAGERIRDQRTGAVYDHRRRDDVLHREILLPTALERAGLPWARNRSTLWNAAEQAESRPNARVAREFMVALPHELNAADRLTLARGFARELVERYHTAVDLVLHAPRDDARNFHAHLLSTTRQVLSNGLGRKADLELSGTQRHQQGLLRWAEERAWLRERWATLTNEALKAAHLTARVSAAYGVADPARTPRLPSIAYHIEQRGGHSVWAERIRERHRQRLGQAAARSAEPPEPASASWLERVRAQARAAWLALRRNTTEVQAGWMQNAARQRVALETQSVRAKSASASVPEQVQEQGPEPGSRPRSDRAPPLMDELAQQSWRRWKSHRQEVASSELQAKSKTLSRQLQPERGVNVDLEL